MNQVKRNTILLLMSIFIHSAFLFGEEKEISYEYFIQHSNDLRPLEHYIISAETAAFSDPAIKLVSHSDSTLCASIPNTLANASWTITVAEAGYYNMEMRYASDIKSSDHITLSVFINGENQFSESSRVLFSRPWQDAADIRQDSAGNDIRPDQVPYGKFVIHPLQCDDGTYNDPYLFYLSKGENEVSIGFTIGDFYFDHIKIYNIPTPLKYSKWRAQNPFASADGEELVVFEAERTATIKSTSFFFPRNDKSDPATNPSSPRLYKYNVIGGSSWAKDGQWIVFEIDVPESGYYELGFKSRQKDRIGVTSYRRIYIDGMIPFEEMLQVPFSFSTGWKITMVGGENPCLFYLDKGKHEIKIESIPGTFTDYFVSLRTIAGNLMALYSDIFAIVGPNPDQFRDYYIDSEIPDLHVRLSTNTEQLEKITKELLDSKHVNYSAVSVLDRLVITNKLLQESPRNIPLNNAQFGNRVTSLYGWLWEMNYQPLEIDQIFIKKAQAKPPVVKVGFFQRIWYSISSLIGTFFRSYTYTAADATKERRSIVAWVGMGEEQLKVLGSYIGTEFTAKTGIEVDLDLVNRDILAPILAGRGPDVGLLMEDTKIMNLAMRGAVNPLSDFPGFHETLGWFFPETITPYMYNGQQYAIPNMQTFPVMFYRTDILEEYGIDVPQTWDDLYRAAEILQTYHMNIGLLNQYSGRNFAVLNTTVDFTRANLSIFFSRVYQRGGRIYLDDLSGVNIDSGISKQEFANWCDMYNVKGFLPSLHFLSRFRDDSAPIFFEPYTSYVLVQSTAHEIQGKWYIAPMVGTRREDGTIDRSAYTLVRSGTMIVKKAEDQEACWEFVKWFSSPDTQYAFGMLLENNIGLLGRYAPASFEAFSRLPWRSDVKEVILEQWKEVFDLPPVPGNYYMTRLIDQEFRRILATKTNPNELLQNIEEDINSEIQRKRTEFGLE